MNELANKTAAELTAELEAMVPSQYEQMVAEWPIGRTFGYMGRTCVVVGHADAVLPSIYMEYLDGNSRLRQWQLAYNLLKARDHAMQSGQASIGATAGEHPAITAANITAGAIREAGRQHTSAGLFGRY